MKSVSEMRHGIPFNSEICRDGNGFGAADGTDDEDVDNTDADDDEDDEDPEYAGGCLATMADEDDEYLAKELLVPLLELNTLFDLSVSGLRSGVGLLNSLMSSSPSRIFFTLLLDTYSCVFWCFAPLQVPFALLALPLLVDCSSFCCC